MQLVNNREAPAAFYLGLPSPWNIVPSIAAPQNEDVLKSIAKGRLILFDGKKSSYDSWREKFLQCIHLKQTSPAAKALALQASLDVKNHRLKLLADSMSLSQSGYRDVIEDLEAEYGGGHRLRQERLKQVLQIGAVKAGDLASIHEFELGLKGYVAAVDQVGGQNAMDEEDETFSMVAGKLDAQLGIRFCDWLALSNTLPCVRSLLAFLKSEVTRCRKLGDFQRSTAERARRPQARTFVARGGETDEDEEQEIHSFQSNDIKSDMDRTDRLPPDCDACTGQHLLRDCSVFLAKSAQERLDLIAEKNRCYRCLRLGHTAYSCSSSIKCKTCDKRHHSLLHGAKTPRRKKQDEHAMMAEDFGEDEDATEDIPIKVVEASFQASDQSTVSLGTVPVDLTCQESRKTIEVNALQDGGNTMNLLSEDGAKALGLKGYQEPASIQGVGGHRIKSRIKARITLSSKDGLHRENIWVRVVPKPAGTLKAIDWNEHKAKFPHLKRINFPKPCERKTVDLILGTSAGSLIRSMDRDVHGQNIDDPTAKHTPLGWVASGKTDPDIKTEEAANYLSFFIMEMEHSKQESMSEEVKGLLCSEHSVADYSFLAAQEEGSLVAKEGTSTRARVVQGPAGPSDDLPRVVQGSAGSSGDPPRVVQGPEGPSGDPPRVVQGPAGPSGDPHLPFCPDPHDEKLQRYLPSMEEENSRLSDLVEAQWKMEETPQDEERALSPNEVRALNLLKSRGEYKDGKVTMPCLWKEGEPDLVNNYEEAKRIYMARMRTPKMRDPKIREEYNSKLRKYREKGYFREVDDRSGRFYLTHFPVYREDKVSSQVRPVFNGAMKFKGKSLNDATLAGPKLINDLPEVPLNFRRERVCLSCDVREMFLQIGLFPEDQKFHHFFWSESGQAEDIREYQWVKHIFGNAGSPCVAIFVIKNHAENRRDRYPKASYVVTHATVVDDNICSQPDEATMIETVKELKEFYSEMGMKVAKFMSNSPAVLATLSEDEKAPDLDIADLQASTLTTPTLKALGVFYSSRPDVFSFRKELPEAPKRTWTKRQILSYYASLFDPLGLIMPVVIHARIIFQRLWVRPYGWDDDITEEDLQEWNAWLQQVPNFPHFRIPRCLLDTSHNSPVMTRSLHIFVDASEAAFSAVAYQLCIYLNGDKSSRMVASRAKLAPLKAVTIPRLELMGAVLGKELSSLCLKVLQQDEVFFWTDSQNVLCWLHSEDRNLQKFVANRIAKIQKATDVLSWRWIESESNPADLASRGKLAGELVKDTLWWEGPIDAMMNPPKAGKPNEVPATAKEECRRGELFTFMAAQERERQTVQAPGQVIDASRIGSWTKLVRTTAFCKRYIENLRKKATKSRTTVKVTHQKLEPRGVLSVRKYNPPLSTVVPPLTTEEIKWAEDHIIQTCQWEAFPEDMKRLVNLGAVAPKSKLNRLRPCLDKNGIMRTAGRLRSSENLPEDMKCPIILPRKNHVSQLIIRHYHTKVLKHTAGTSHTLAELNQKYWTIGGRSEVRRILEQCTPCGRKNAKAKQQEMAPLPEHRYLPEKTRVWPFYHTGVDAAGPFEVNLGRGTRKNQALHKRYFIIFSCSVFRCVHFEMVSGLSSDVFLQCFSRFLARRPRPRFINSDNGGNFEGAEAIIRELHTNLKAKHSELSKEFEDISWTFNTPLTPHQGGHYERLIGSMKKSLAVTLPSVGPLKEEELHTCLTVCEGLLNSRPISYVSSDPDDLLPLTPAHFLMQGACADIGPALSFKPTRMELCNRWLHIQQAMDRLWGRFIKEVIPGMNKMNQWTTKRRDLQAGDIVVLLENKSRGIWPIGRITETYRNEKDGHVRRAKILCKGKIYDRSLSRIMVIQENSPQN